ncbi:hypothetical protein [Tannockella kyphosi]|uniref:hypothetical protein n=1 Tax=Tannockella kyphosi TaxID=2899121 RepID=UPI00201146EF|nr:hypothetical protein [Tannockella kyphosi]
MNKEQIFYHTLSEIDFMNLYFHKKYLISLNEETVYQLETNKEQPLATFFKKYPIKKLLKNNNSIQTKDNILIIKNQSNLNHVTVLEFKTQSDPISTFSFPINTIPLFENSIYHSSKVGPYILHFDFYTNIDLSNLEIEKEILNILRQTIPYLGTHFLREDVNDFYLFLFEGNDSSLIDLLETIHLGFKKITDYYIQPCFHITKMPPKNIINQVMQRLKKHAKQLTRDDNQLAHYIPYELLIRTK